MKRKNITRSALFTSIISLLLCISMLAGTTFAWFTDSVKSGINTIAAGVLDVEMEYLTNGEWKKVDETTKLFDENALWEPGHTEVAYLRISNAGDLALKYQLGINIANQTGSVNKAGESFMLSDHIVFGVLEDVQTPYATREEARNAVTTPNPLTAGYAKQQPLLPGDEPDCVALVVYMPENVGNEANYATGHNPPKIELGIKLTAAQQLHESDSFGNDYDIFAEFPKGTLDISVAAPVVKAEDGTTTTAVKMGGAGTGVSAAVPQGVAMADDAAALSLTVKTMAESGANITMSDDQISASVDVHMAGVAEGNTVPMIITLERYLPGGINTGALALYHVENGTPVAMTQVADPVNHNEFSYDPLTGDVKLALASFSEVAVIADTNNSWDGVAATAFADGNGSAETPYLIADAGQLAYFRNQVDAGEMTTAHVKLENNINLSNVNFDPIGWGYVNTAWNSGSADGKVFQGTFDGNGKTIFNLYQNGWELEEASNGGKDYTYTNCGFGLFAAASNATFKNLTISGADIKTECVEMGVLVGLSQNNCTYENVNIFDSKIANYQRPAGGLIGEVSGSGTTTITGVTIGSNVVVGTLWGDFDGPCGGVIGARWDDAGKNPQIVMDNVYVAARMDVYNDITAAYQWHAYRRAGMLIGNTDIPAADGRTAQTAKAPFLTCTNVRVSYGDWANYTYCQFTNHNSRYPWVRTQVGENCDAFSNPRWGVPNDINGKRVVDMNHEHQEGDGCGLKRPFAQLYGGGQGVYGASEHDGVTITNVIYTVTYMNGTTVEYVDYVTDNSTSYVITRDPGDNMQWIDNEGRVVTTIPAGNTKNIVVYKDNAKQFVAYFVDKDGAVIYSETFVKGQETLANTPEPPQIEGYTGKWETYNLKEAEGSIVIKPYYTVDEGAEELFKLDIDALFQWLTDGKTVVMTQELTGGQGNASKADCATVVNGDGAAVNDKEARLNLNGYTLAYEFSSNANKDWNIFNILGDSTLAITGGIADGGTLRMNVTTLNGNAVAYLFEMHSGATLKLEKGVVVEFEYPATAKESQVSLFGRVTGNNKIEAWNIDTAAYEGLNIEHDKTNHVMRITANQTVVIKAP